MDWNRIRQARQQKGYTLKQVAEMTGYSVGYISQLERRIDVEDLTCHAVYISSQSFDFT